jgi:hypothetical protein
MVPANVLKPATADTVYGLRDFGHLAGPLRNNDTSPNPALQLRGDLVGGDKAIAGDIMASGTFELCRRLLAAGANPAAELVCYRNGRPALRIKSIRAGAELTIRETATDGPRVVSWKAFPDRAVAAPVRSNRKREYPAPSGESATRVPRSEIEAMLEKQAEIEGTARKNARRSKVSA